MHEYPICIFPHHVVRKQTFLVVLWMLQENLIGNCQQYLELTQYIEGFVWLGIFTYGESLKY